MAIIDSTTSDAKLVAAALSGDEHAFQEIVRRYHTMVYALAVAKLRDHEAAEDLAQEVFLRVYLHLRKLSDPRFLGTWIGRITRNLAEDWRKSNQRTSHFLPTISIDGARIDIKESDVKPVPEQMDDNQREEILNEAIRDLPTNEREIVLLHFMQGWNYREIAEKLQKDPTTVSRTLKKTVDDLRAKVGAALDRPRKTATPPTRPSAARTAAMIAAVWALPLEAKASLAAATEGIVAASSINTTGSPGLFAAIAQWFKMLSVLQKIAVGIISAGAITGGAVVVEQAALPASSSHTTQAATTISAPPAAVPAKWDVKAPGLEGPWISEMKGETLVILILLENDKYAGSVYNGGHARGKMPLTSVSQDGGNVTISTKNSFIHFEGQRTAPDTLTGKYSEKARSFPLTLKRVANTPIQPLPPPHKEVPIDPSKLDRLTGFYAKNSTDGITVTREGNAMYVDFGVYERLQLFPESDTLFFSKEIDFEVEFKGDDKGVVNLATANETLTNNIQSYRKLTPEQRQRVFREPLQRVEAPAAKP